MSIVDSVITKLQNHALACSTIAIKAAPDYPPEDGSILPLAIGYISSGTAQADNATTSRMLLVINVDIHLSRVTMKSAYTQVNQIIPEYLGKLCADPTLGGVIQTIIFPVNVQVFATDWGSIETQCVQFQIQIKYIGAIS